MQAIKCRIKTLAPLIFTSKSGDPNMVSTLDYIPGKQIWGLFANEYINKNNLFGNAEEDPKFLSWFIDGKIKFSNFYITDIEGKKAKTYFPLPLCLQKEKYGNYAYDIFQIDPSSKIDTKPIDSYGIIEDSVIYTKKVNKSLNFHHKRDRKRGVSEEGIIFNYESINQNQIFEGLITGQRDDLREFTKLFHDNIYFIGRSRHNQYGMIKYEILNSEPFELESEMKISLEEDEFILYLISDTIILNEKGFSTVNIEDFERLTGLKVKNSLITASNVESYISVWKAKTPSDVCFKAGSCFLIEIRRDDFERIRKLLIEGIGEMTHLGYGRFRLFRSLHEKYDVLQEWKKEISSVPKNISDTTKKLILSLVEENLKIFTEKKAMSDATNFEKIPSTSLLSKLEKAAKERKLEEVLKNMEDKQAKHKLEECNNGKVTLYSFLLEPKLQAQNILREIEDLNKLLEEIQSDFEISKYDDKLKEVYFVTLLSTLRKKAKEKKRR